FGSESRYCIHVKDSGVGIAREFLATIFDRLQQVDSSTTKKFGGLGLGLAIARSLVEMHGGQIRAESEGLGKGATFVVEIPLVEKERLTVPGKDASAAALTDQN